MDLTYPQSESYCRSMTEAQRARDWLSRKYGVDLAGVSDTEVVARSATILGVRCDGEAATAVAVSLRIDGDWDEDAHPRAADGKFGGGGGSSAGDNASTRVEHDIAAHYHREKSGEHFTASRLATGPGSSQLAGDHMAASQAHMEAARAHTAASDGGMTKLAVNSPKARAASVAAKIATERVMSTQSVADHQAAAEANRAAGRTGTAKSHEEAAATQQKNTMTHGQAALAIDKSQTETRAAAGTSQHVHANTHARNADASATAAKNMASGTSPAARASARKAAESAAMARVAAEHGDHAGAAQHAATAQRHSEAAQSKAKTHRDSVGRASSNFSEASAVSRTSSSGSGPVSPEKQKFVENMRTNADRLSRTANEASDAAHASGTKEDHQKAFDAHGEALVAQRALGRGASSGHGPAMDHHERQMNVASGLAPSGKPWSRGSTAKH